METTGSRRLDNGNQNEPVPGVLDNGNRNEPECRTKLRPGLWVKGMAMVPGYRFNILKVKETEKTKGKGEDERGKRKGKEKGKRKRENRNGAGNISKVWWFLSLNVWNLTFRRFSPAFTLASDI
ncbi:unnamed protein product [Rhizophagus irregularis]|nr:unnamed protein product [Rhizophagus irregularis]